MAKRLIFSFIVICIIVASTLTVIAFAKGYRLDFDNKNLSSTGILAIASSPDGASVYANGELITATNSSINLSPSWYDVKVVKEGYIPWQKRLRIQGEVATKISALLIPTNPSLKPLTSLGVLNPILSPSQTQLAYIVPFDASASGELQKKAGIWIWNLREGPVLPIGSGPKQLARSTEVLDFSNAKLLWSPDEKQLIASFFTEDKIADENLEASYLLDTDTTLQIPTLTTATIPTVLEEWQITKNELDKTISASLPKKLQPLLKNAIANIRFAEDETKFMYDATASATIPLLINPPLIGANASKEERIITPGNTYLYDIKEDKNFLIKALPEITPTPALEAEEVAQTIPLAPVESLSEWMQRGDHTIFWYPDSKHIFMIEKDTIYIEEYDGLNKTTVYAGPFENSFVFPWPQGGRILILTNLSRGTHPNLYAVDLR